MKVVISLGGSVLEPKNISFLKNFVFEMTKRSKKNTKVVIYCGGGRIARQYISLAEQFKLSPDSLDWIGISATCLNAEFLKRVFGHYASDTIIRDPTNTISFKKNIVIAAGWKPGRSTDYGATLAAKNIGAQKIINITNISHVYTKDPYKFRDAKKLKKVQWKEFIKLVGDKWTPGLNMPFDPIASKIAAKNKLKVIIINADIKKLRDCLGSKDFDGTLIY